MKAPTRNSRLDDLASKLRIALRRETLNIVEIGDILRQSQMTAGHGEFLPWLRENFDLSQRSAYNYMAASAFAEQNRKVATIANLAPSVLYALAEGRYLAQEEKAILAASCERRIDIERAADICQAIKPPPSPPSAPPPSSSPPLGAKDDDNVEKILDGPPLAVQPPTPMQSRTQADFALQSFEEAVAKLKPLVTRPSPLFENTVHSADDLEKVESFIRAVADRVRKVRSP